MNKTVIFPGTFDPITYGHLNIIKRTTKIFSHVIIAIYHHSQKKTLFNLKERIQLVKDSTCGFKNIKKIFGFNELLINVAKKEKTNIIIRGIRSTSDFEYEHKMNKINKNLNPYIENIFFFSDHQFSFISSSTVKKIATFNGNLKNFVPKNVLNALKKKYSPKTMFGL